jgi:hypothetical protein
MRNGWDAPWTNLPFKDLCFPIPDERRLETYLSPIEKFYCRPRLVNPDLDIYLDVKRSATGMLLHELHLSTLRAHGYACKPQKGLGEVRKFTRIARGPTYDDFYLGL